MQTAQAVGVYEISEVRIEDWVLAALRMQQGLALTSRRPRRMRRQAAPSRRRPPTRGSLWVMLAASCLGLCLL